MCTVTFYQDKWKTILTSNRDEHKDRPTAALPTKYKVGNNAIYYPKDPLGGGTWFAISEQGGVFVLLNGAAKKHVHSPPYRKSRGLVLLDLAADNDVIGAWNTMDLLGIEPFTIIAYAKQILRQLRWDGNTKNSIELDTSIPHIWSSSSLYDPEAILTREEWFKSFLMQSTKPMHDNDFMSFHSKTATENKEYGLIINRDNGLLTKSITQCIVDDTNFLLRHIDFISEEKSLIKEPLL